MLTEKDCCFLIKGEFFAAPFSDTCSSLVPFGCSESIQDYRPLGNIISANIQHNYQLRGRENEYHKNYNKKARAQIVDMEMELIFTCPNNANIKEFLFTDVEKQSSGSDTKYFYETCSSTLKANEQVFMLKKRNLSNVVVTLVNHDASTSVLQEGVDYRVDGPLLRLTKDITLASDFKYFSIEFDYDESNFSLMKPFTKDYRDLSLYFSGTNFADVESESAFDVEFFKFTPFSFQELEMIQQNNFLTFSLQGRIQKFYDDSDVKSFYTIKKGVI
mgnify:CR=1 FL=1